ncbi:hypothetical protein C8N46_1128 [Kordia periserrulae]|uniref:Uncharacterized protein n=1 Tax=Kordia periserrulae TaxID=701523 RepID=A0A2T6BRI6_9FLAO|nr:hypothetical protein [Kordia periserrulae]PTX58700.1 hypothetical protein C8N46_1128 [Kordia periserrulae]
MRAQKLLLLIFTAIITMVLLFVGVITYFRVLNADGMRSPAIFFLGCTGAFSVYFHFKTREFYPFKKFNAPLEELSKKYWALHISFGLILLLLGIYSTVFWLQSTQELSKIIPSIVVMLLGIWTLLDMYVLNKFIVSHKERLERREEIENIKGTTKES